MHIVIASKNEKKKREMQSLLHGHTVLSLSDIGYNDDIPETGETFAENAYIKAAAVYGYLKKTGLDGYAAIADDSGLCVDALQGAPGIYSARYCDGSDDDRIDHLLENMEGIPAQDRAAHFQCAICLYAGEAFVIRTEGTVSGSILFSRDGTGGFGYDPIFLCSETGKSFGQMSEDDKNKVSHRARALAELSIKLKDGSKNADQ